MTLEAVTRENVRAICDLRLGDGQDRLVAPAAFTVAEGHYEPGALLRAITLDGAQQGRGFWEPCGFTDTGRIEHGEPRHRKAL